MRRPPPLADAVGTFKVNPYALDSFMRLYFGADAMATNGLRYGAAIELRENFTGQISSNTSTNASGYSSLSTRSSCAAPSPTLPARIGASFASAWPMA